MGFRRQVVPGLIALVSACDGTQVITAPRPFWSGHWWPFSQVAPGRKLYDAGDALDRYWQYLQATRAPASPVQFPPTARDREVTIPAPFGPHSCAGACAVPRDFCGHCNAFTAASMMEPEPTALVTKTIIRYLVQDPNGQWVVGATPAPVEEGVPPPPEVRVETTVVEFGVGHQKGLLTELWTNFEAVFRGLVNDPGPTVGEWEEMLEEFEDEGFAVDLRGGPEVWNHPVHRATVRSRESRQAQVTTRDVTAVVEYVDYAQADFVGQLLRAKTYNYRIRSNGNNIISQWVGDRPGSIFRPVTKRPADNDLVLDPCVREIIDRGTETIHIRSTADFRPWPCT